MTDDRTAPPDLGDLDVVLIPLGARRGAVSASVARPFLPTLACRMMVKGVITRPANVWAESSTNTSMPLDLHG
jgi:hypothetical protein